MSTGLLLLAAIGGSVPPTITVSGETVSEAAPGHAIAGIRFNSDGTVDGHSLVSGYYQVDSGTDWRIPNGSGAGYHVRATLDSGDTPTGTLSSWLALSTSREWYFDILTGSKNCNLTIAVSDDGGSTTLDSATYTLNAAA